VKFKTLSDWPILTNNMTDLNCKFDQMKLQIKLTCLGPPEAQVDAFAPLQRVFSIGQRQHAVESQVRWATLAQYCQGRADRFQLGTGALRWSVFCTGWALRRSRAASCAPAPR
jgi:hypothetical protein